MKTIRRIALTKEEVDSLKTFCDENLERGLVIIDQLELSGIGPTTKVMVKDLPETLTDITDVSAW
jgi:hypothetical protein